MLRLLRFMGLLPRLLLQVRWAAASGESGSPAIRWSAVQGSFGFVPLPHIQQVVALSLICLARLR